jgi:tetratricopeptide (TPR) repeat protein
LESLLDKSLLRQFVGVSGDTRFSMLETVREYAFEKLAQSGDLPVLQQAHAKQIEALLDKVNTTINAPGEAIWFAKMDDEIENLRTAVEWALGRAQPALVFKAGNLYDYWFRRRSNYHEPLRWLERALAIEVSTANDVLSLRAWALNTTGVLKYQTGEMQQAHGYFESGLALFRETGDRAGMSECLKNMGDLEFSQKNLEHARQYYEQSLAIVEVETFYTSITLNNLGELERMGGNRQASSDYYLRARQICERLGAEAGVSYANMFLGRLALEQRDLPQALAYFDSALKAGWVQQNPLYKGLVCGISGYVYLLVGDRVKAQRLLQQSLEASAESLMISPDLLDCWFIFEGKARLELSDANAERAARLFGAASTQRIKDDYPLTEFERPGYDAAITEARAEIGDAAFEQAFANGQAMTIAQVIQFALNST